MKGTLHFLLAWLISYGALAQDTTVVKNFKDTLVVKIKFDTTYWQRSFSGGINLNQASFTNWSGGGINSIALGSTVSARALYMKGQWSWDNTGDFQLGYITQEGVRRKSSDQILITSAVGLKASPVLDYFFSSTFSSYFAPGYQYTKLAPEQTQLKISNFLSPGQLSLAWGLAYKPQTWLSVRLSPFSPRFTFLLDNDVRYRNQGDTLYIRDPTATVYGVRPGRRVRTEWLALQLQATLNKNVTDNISVNAKYLMYANYQTLNAIDHRIDLTVTAKVTRYISTTFGIIALLDKDYSPSLQLQQTLAVGLLYNVSTFREKKKKATAK
ncbi:DUF3078 domain-containing protein [Spirosoma sp. KUDC1026]|uniref:DUF3078 domain-containing protein n=1 Tax=Spirosoma sp. KUDC1026 TaxID=2745947 RepID=UPI00159BCDA6|nr:DUF3078 domain-containing protein [Spirosoma sp. KUDC1026]QKZ12072.1 DUF3078 domain-containing protein [Spirosoma sp. KUDC1026]